MVLELYNYQIYPEIVINLSSYAVCLILYMQLWPATAFNAFFLEKRNL
jgi:hypothetical protein